MLLVTYEWKTLDSSRTDERFTVTLWTQNNLQQTERERKTAVWVMLPLIVCVCVLMLMLMDLFIHPSVKFSVCVLCVIYSHCELCVPTYIVIINSMKIILNFLILSLSLILWWITAGYFFMRFIHLSVSIFITITGALDCKHDFRNKPLVTDKSMLVQH